MLTFISPPATLSVSRSVDMIRNREKTLANTAREYPDKRRISASSASLGHGRRHHRMHVLVPEASNAECHTEDDGTMMPTIASPSRSAPL